MMKRLFFTLITVMALMATATAQQRILVLIEEFTNTGCGPCASWSPVLDSAIHYRMGDCIAIKYHWNHPYEGDEFYNYDPEPQIARKNLYSITGVPATFVDGISLAERTFGYLNAVVSWCREQPAAGDLTVSKELGSDHLLTARATFTPYNNMEAANVRLFVAAIEEHIERTTPYPNGERELNYTMRKMLTGGEGHDMGVTLNSGQAYDYEGQWTMDFFDDVRQLGVVAFVQDLSTHDVLATAYIGPEAEGENRMELINVIDTPDLICTPLFQGKAIFRNDGAGIISSATLNVRVNGYTKQYPWTGSLAYLERDTMAFADFSGFMLATDGKNKAELWLSDINGTDRVSGSRTVSFANSVQAKGGVLLKIYTDKKPEETTWTLYDSAGDVVQQGGPYDGLARKFVNDTLRLTRDDCYQIEFHDAGGDGIKGATGNGYYQLLQLNADGKTTRIAQGDYARAVHDVYFRLDGTPAEAPLVLFEEFTNTSCDPCAEFSPFFDETIFRRMGEMVPVTYHWNFPSPQDPFYLNNPDDVNTRAAYYGISGVPSLFAQGYHAGARGYEDQLDSYIDVCRTMEEMATQVKVETEAIMDDDGLLTVRARLLPLSDLDGSRLRLFVVAVEERVEWDEPAANGERSWNYVMRKILPSAGGQTLESGMTALTPYYYDYTWPVEGYEDPRELGIVTFVQDVESKAVVGTCYTPRPTGDRRAAKILQVLDMPDRICQPQFTAKLVVRNTGSETLRQATLNVSINGTLQQTPWTGTLRPLAIDTLETPLFTDFALADGKANAVELWLSDLNGSAQQTVHRQTALTNAYAAKNAVRLTIMTDQKPEEITWAVRNSAGDIVCQGGPYSEARKKQVVDLPLTTDDCYSLEFQDAGGNGITGQNGRGYYMLHEVSAEGKTRLLVQADYTTATHEVFFSLQNAAHLTTGVPSPAVGYAATPSQPNAQPRDLQGRPATQDRKGILILNNKKTIKY